ncbi:MAG: hypothetical protein ACOY4G_07060 [Pseudomonadota bacterium]
MNGACRSDAAQAAVESACARRRVSARRFIPGQGEAIDAFRAEALS